LCRFHHPERQGMNTCWDTKRNTRPANNGSRIDYILCSDGLKSWFTYADIQPGLMGSDHCPVYATLAEAENQDGELIQLSNIMNPPSMFAQGTRIRDWQRSDLLPLSAKLLPNFDRRRNIRDMFSKKPAPSSANRAQTTEATDPYDPKLAAANVETSSTAPSARQQIECQTTEALAIGAVVSSSPVKRPAPAMPSMARRKKRGKNEPVITAPGQMTLKGFFTPASVAVSRNGLAPKLDDADVESPSLHPSSSNAATPSGIVAERNTQTDAATQDPERVFDPVESKDQWSKLLRKPEAPRCEHDEPCISLVTKKPGVNCGRSFYICPRPLGPSGEKEKDSEWRCATFIWSSDWNRP
jgi:AP endonuclease-2